MSWKSGLYEIQAIRLGKDQKPHANTTIEKFCTPQKKSPANLDDWKGLLMVESGTSCGWGKDQPER